MTNDQIPMTKHAIGICVFDIRHSIVIRVSSFVIPNLCCGDRSFHILCKLLIQTQTMNLPNGV